MRVSRLVAWLALLGAGAPAAGAQVRPDETTVLDSNAVFGNTRVPTSTVLAIASIPTGKPVSYRDIQRGLQALYATGQCSWALRREGGRSVAVRLAWVARPRNR